MGGFSATQQQGMERVSRCTFSLCGCEVGLSVLLGCHAVQSGCSQTKQPYILPSHTRTHTHTRARTRTHTHTHIAQSLNLDFILISPQSVGVGFYCSSLTQPSSAVPFTLFCLITLLVHPTTCLCVNTVFLSMPKYWNGFASVADAAATTTLTVDAILITQNVTLAPSECVLYLNVCTFTRQWNALLLQEIFFSALCKKSVY